MAGLRDPFRYREGAAYFLELAKAATDSPELRDSYLALVLQYERLARILEEKGALSSADTKGNRAGGRI
jgi:hypothetical protein